MVTPLPLDVLVDPNHWRALFFFFLKYEGLEACCGRRAAPASKRSYAQAPTREERERERERENARMMPHASFLHFITSTYHFIYLKKY